jgi:hypothetical protein
VGWFICRATDLQTRQLGRSTLVHISHRPHFVDVKGVQMEENLSDNFKGEWELMWRRSTRR